MIKRIGWVAAVIAPAAAVFGILYLPYPGSILLAIVSLGGLVGYLLYEHALHREEVPNSVIWEQSLLAVIILIGLSTVI